MKRLNRLFVFILFSMNLLILGCNKEYKDLDLTAYQYQDTKNLIRFVYKASLLLEKHGLESIDTFKHNKYYSQNKYYFYIYGCKESVYRKTSCFDEKIRS